MYLFDISWSSFQKKLTDIDTILIPMGAVEQYGPHLPLGSDFIVALELAKRTAVKDKHSIVVPFMPFGLSYGHLDFSGTISVTAETFSHILIDVSRSLIHHGLCRFFCVTTHPFNIPVVLEVSRRIADEYGALMYCCNCWELTDILLPELAETKPRGHGGEIHTSIMLAIDKNRVMMDQAPEGELPKKMTEKITAVSTEGVKYGPAFVNMPVGMKEIVNSGSIGYPKVASKQKGEKYLDKISNFLAQLVDEMRKVRLPKAKW